VQAQPLWTAEEQGVADTNNRQRLQSLKAVDRAIVAVIDAVEAAGKRESTLFVLTSDNGMMFGEHRLISKGVGYEESVRIPLVLANPAFTPGTSDTLVAMPLDIPATIQSLAGLSLEGEGQDLAPWLCGEGGAGRDHVLVEAWFGEKVPAWSGLITTSYSYLEAETGEGSCTTSTSTPTSLTAGMTTRPRGTGSRDTRQLWRRNAGYPSLRMTFRQAPSERSTGRSWPGGAAWSRYVGLSGTGSCPPASA
jgi:hypothetical protein